MLRKGPVMLLLLGATLVASVTLKADPVKVAVYDESYCPDCRDYIGHQLAPTYRELKDIMEVHLNAYGWAQDEPDGQGGYIFDCQHGPEECVGNQILGCADKYITDADTFVDFAGCFMSQDSSKQQPLVDGKKCSYEVGADWATIKKCANSQEGQQIHHDAGVEFNSLDPMPTGVPHITINGEGSDDASYDLKKTVCDTYTGPKPAACNSELVSDYLMTMLELAE